MRTPPLLLHDDAPRVGLMRLAFERLRRCADGGLGTTAEAMRCGKPVAVSGVLHQDQRLWGRLVECSGLGPPACHIDVFLRRRCVAFVDMALDEASAWSRNAAAWRVQNVTRGGSDKQEGAAGRAAGEGDAWMADDDDGVAANVEAFRRLLEVEGLEPVDPRRLRKQAARVAPL